MIINLNNLVQFLLKPLAKWLLPPLAQSLVPSLFLRSPPDASSSSSMYMIFGATYPYDNFMVSLSGKFDYFQVIIYKPGLFHRHSKSAPQAATFLYTSRNQYHRHSVYCTRSHTARSSSDSPTTQVRFLQLDCGHLLYNIKLSNIKLNSAVLRPEEYSWYFFQISYMKFDF